MGLMETVELAWNSPNSNPNPNPHPTAAPTYGRIGVLLDVHGHPRGADAERHATWVDARVQLGASRL